MRLQNPFERHAPQRAARFPEKRVGFAVGDIHGRADLLARMLELLENKAPFETRDGAPPVVVFLGDYIDRGRDSVGVLNMLLDGRPKGFVRRFLKGNHEQAMLAFLADPVRGRDWIAHGGLETLTSYGVRPLPPQIGATEEELRAAVKSLNEVLPAPHRAFLTGLERYATIGDYTFVHAGVDPSKSIDDQTDEDLFWIRDRFLNSKKPYPKCIVHGHTPADFPYQDHRRVGIDTGAYASGRLTAARFEDDRVEFISVTER